MAERQSGEEAATCDESGIVRERQCAHAANKSVSFLEFGRKRATGRGRGREGESGAASGEEAESEGSLALRVFQNTRREEEDGMQHVAQLETFKCRYGEDLRVGEVRTCLQTTRPVHVKLAQGPDVSDHDFIEVSSLCVQLKDRSYSKRISCFVLLFYCLLEQFCEV